MSNEVSLYRLPTQFDGNIIDIDDLHEVVYNEDYDEYLLVYTSFSKGDSYISAFEVIFGILISDNDYYKIYNKHAHEMTVDRLSSLNLEEDLQKRVDKFIKAIEEHLALEHTLFFYCG